TDDCLYGAKLALNGTIVAFKIGMTTSTIVVSVTDCPSWNVFKAYRCFESNIQAAIDLIDYIEKEGVPIIQRAVALAKKLPPDFKKCFGFANQSKLMLYQSLNNAKCFSMI
ncbi:hypothetical protein, partial [Acinetobacter pittii]|uniref:hypothetical protein n=1 Tax=Acinetobacter pittii TaxID=48296 RepID=UPI001A90E136